jgi:hypothetical protein
MAAGTHRASICQQTPVNVTAYVNKKYKLWQSTDIFKGDEAPGNRNQDEIILPKQQRPDHMMRKILRILHFSGFA